MIVFLSLVFIATSILCVWCYEIYRKNKMLQKIPGPLPIPFFGIALPKTIYDVFNMMQDLIKKYGKTVKLYIGDRLYVVTCDADLIEEIMKSTIHIQKSELYFLARPFLIDGILLSHGEKWKQRRKYLTPSFHFAMLKEFFPIFVDRANVLIKKLGEQADAGTTTDALKIVSKFTLDVITETSIGAKLNLQENSENKYPEAIFTFMETLNTRNFSFWKRFELPFKLFAEDYNDYFKATETLNNIGKDLIAKRRKEFQLSDRSRKEFDSDYKKKVTLIDALMQHSKLNDENILEEVNTFMFAGSDTTGATLSFALHELSKWPDVQEKLYNEIRSKSENLTQGDIQEMKYLEQILKEIIRYRTPVPFIERELETDAKFGDTVYPKGTTISMLLYWVHHHSDYYPDPDKFDPERFNPDNPQTQPTFAYVPFSAGPRNCIGQKFALLELKVALTKIIKEFKIHPVNDVEIVLGTGSILRSKYGLPIKVERRQN